MEVSIIWTEPSWVSAKASMIKSRMPSNPPTNEPVAAGRVRSKALRQTAPWGAQYPEDAVEDTSVVDPKHAALLVRKERLTAIHSKSVEAEF
jgi:hypothetical protein